MKHLKHRLKLGWRVLSDIHTALWLLGGIATIPALVVAWGVYVGGLPWPVIVAIVILAYALVALVLLGTIGVAVEHTSAAVTSSTPPAVKAPAPAPAPALTTAATKARSSQADTGWKFITGVDPDYLLGFFANHMNVEAQRLIEPYLNQSTTIRGELEDVAYERKYKISSAYLAGNTLVRQLVFHFRNDDAEKISRVPRGTLLDITGQVESVDGHQCALNNCRFTVLRWFP